MIKHKGMKIGLLSIVAMILVFSSVSVSVYSISSEGNEKVISTLVSKIPNKIKESMPELKEFYQDEPPDWADGWYIGAWLDKNGDDYNILGYLAGYYHKGTRPNRGFYAGVWNVTGNNTFNGMGGIALGIFTFGRIQLPNEKKIPYTGFLFTNQTHFVGRIMSVVGPPVYMYGIHQPLV